MDADIPTTAAMQSHSSAVSNRCARVSLSLEKVASRAGPNGQGLVDSVRELGGFIGDFVQEMDSLAVLLTDASSMPGPSRLRLHQLLSAIEEVMVAMTSVLEVAMPRGDPSTAELRSLASSSDLWWLFMQLVRAFQNLIQMEDPDDADQILASTDSDFEELERLMAQHRLAQTTISDDHHEEDVFPDEKGGGVPPDYDTAVGSSSSIHSNPPSNASTVERQTLAPPPNEPAPTLESQPSSSSKPKSKSKGKVFKSFIRHISSGFNSPEPLLDPLCRASAAGNPDQARGIIAQGANPNGHNEKGHTPLTSAIGHGHLDLVRFLLDNGANVTTNGVSPPYAVTTTKLTPASPSPTSLSQQPPSSSPATKSLPPLFHAANTGNTPLVSHLIYRGADPKAENTFGTAHFVDATETAPLPALALLLEHGASARSVTFFGRPVVVSAVERGDVALTRLLLDHGAKPSSTSASGAPLLALAVSNRNLDMASLLVEKGADVNGDTPLGGTPLTTAVAQRNLEMVNLLLSAGAAVTVARDGDGGAGGHGAGKGKEKDKGSSTGVSIGKRSSPALITALQKDFVAGTRALLDAGADPDARDSMGRFALVLAVQQGKREHARALLEHGANVKASGLTGSHLLMVLFKRVPQGQAAQGKNKKKEKGKEKEKEKESIKDDGDGRAAADDDDGQDGAGAGGDGSSHSPAKNDDTEAFLRLLLSHGADPDNHGTSWSSVSATPLGHCVKFDRPDLVRAMVENGADPHRAVSASTNSGPGPGSGSGSASAAGKDSPFMYAVTHGKASSVKAMLDNGAISKLEGRVTRAEMDILVDKALEGAAANGERDVMVVLLDAGVGHVERALEFADSTAHRKLVALLEERKAREGNGGVGAEQGQRQGQGQGQPQAQAQAQRSTTLFDAEAEETFELISMRDEETEGHDDAPPSYEKAIGGGG